MTDPAPHSRLGNFFNLFKFRPTSKAVLESFFCLSYWRSLQHFLISFLSTDRILLSQISSLENFFCMYGLDACLVVRFMHASRPEDQKVRNKAIWDRFWLELETSSLLTITSPNCFHYKRYLSSKNDLSILVCYYRSLYKNEDKTKIHDTNTFFKESLKR